MPYEEQAKKLDWDEKDGAFRGPANIKTKKTHYRANKVSKVISIKFLTLMIFLFPFGLLLFSLTASLSYFVVFADAQHCI